MAVHRFDKKDIPKYRPVYYEGERKRADYEQGRDIITLYVFCGLGYSPIRHILGLKNDKLIEDVIRQHRLGRTNVDVEECRLLCPGTSQLNELSTKIIIQISKKYDTMDDLYVHNMLRSARWSDDPVTSSSNKCVCGANIDIHDVTCPNCGKQLKPKRERAMFDIETDP